MSPESSGIPDTGVNTFDAVLTITGVLSPKAMPYNQACHSLCGRVAA